ncbi:MAG: DNA polymerase III subunit alpha [Omnitrophica bacterium RBG_13_46_9]|nr:MAG: DNA polymerase III subunit alpha [Omnitrophica bacterium RBG_13_46_9]
MSKHTDFVHLHVHTQYSLLDGACRLPELIDLAIRLKMPACAITDHGNMFGVIEFYHKAQSKGLKPIIGCEIYLAPESRFEKSSHGIQEASYHLVLLAKDEVGYRNLMKLVSIGYLEGFYYRPRIDKEVLAKYNDGLIGLSACLKGEIPHLILSGEIEAAKRTADQLRHILGKGNFYLELQDNGINDQVKVNKGLIKISKDLDIPLVATNDVHYLSKEDAKAHDALLCIQTQTTLDDPNRMKFQTDEFYFKPAEIMKKAFDDAAPSAISNTIEIAEKCNLELDFSKIHLPQYNVPEGMSREEYLKKLVDEGLKKRYDRIDAVIEDRVKHELRIIQNSGYTSYFLIAWDFVNFAKSKDIPVGPGRGSAAGSVVSYALGITDIDPLRYGLIFERFLNPERITMPDIDIDFCYERRNEVIDYVINKYSKNNVAQIITFGTMMAKGVVRDVGRVMGMPYADVDKIAKLIPNDLAITLERALQLEPELGNLYKNDANIMRLIDVSRKLEGLTRHASTHAAGVVISENDLTNYVPLFETSDGQITTGVPMTSLEKIGLLKMDFLGLRTLTVINKTTKVVKRIQSRDIDIERIPLNDKKTFELLANAETIGIFQLESSGMRDLLKKLKPEKFEEIIALLALFRPGPIGSGMLDDFIRRKHKKSAIKYDHPKLEPILKQTYGIIIFQEQIMRIASELAGFSLAKADTLRRAISKKIPEVMAEARKDFVSGALERDVDEETANKIFNQIEYFAGYGFNLSHSAAYAMISYRTAYLKSNFPVEFMTALLTSERDNTDKIALYISEAIRMNIKILPPDANESFSHFTVVEAGIRFGLGAVKNVGQSAIDSIISSRERFGRFKSIYDFTQRVDSRLVNRKVVESLIKCGAFDSLGLYRSQQIAILDKALEVADGVQKDKLNGQFSFFDAFDMQEGFKKTFQEVPDIPEWTENQLLSYEKEMLGFYITKHPLARFEELLKTYSTCGIASLSTLKDAETVHLGGIISKAKITTTRKTGEKMAIVNLEDLTGAVETLVFPRSFQKFSNLIRVDSMVFISGKLNLREEEPKLIVDEIIPLEEVKSKFTKAVLIKLSTPGLEKSILDNLKNILSRHRGKTPVLFNFQEPNGKRVSISAGARFCVAPDNLLLKEIENLCGSGSVGFKT